MRAEGGKCPVSAVAVGGEDSTRDLLRKIFEEAQWTLIETRGCEEAMQALRENSVHVVISDEALPEGTWLELLRALRRLPDPPLLVVTSRLADERLWAEVLNLGGWDVLAQPFRPEEVTRVIGGALRHFQNEAQRSKRRRLSMSA